MKSTLKGRTGVATTFINGTTPYAVVTASGANAVTIIDMSNPSSPIPTSIRDDTPGRPVGESTRTIPETGRMP